MRQQAITWTNVNPYSCRHLTSLGHNKFSETAQLLLLVNQFLDSNICETTKSSRYHGGLSVLHYSKYSLLATDEGCFMLGHRLKRLCGWYVLCALWNGTGFWTRLKDNCLVSSKYARIWQCDQFSNAESGYYRSTFSRFGPKCFAVTLRSISGQNSTWVWYISFKFYQWFSNISVLILLETPGPPFTNMV